MESIMRLFDGGKNRLTMAPRKSKRWSRRVTQTSNALDLEAGVFSKDSPRGIARSLKRSADRSRRRKSSPFRSAMSMLNFYINRAGKKLSRKRLDELEAAKDELRGLYKRSRSPAQGKRRTRKPAKSTIASADTKGQNAAAKRARKTATPTRARARKSIARNWRNV